MAVIASAWLAVAHAQTPVFEVASIKENRSDNTGVNIAWQPGGRLVATNVTLQILISIAYGEDVPLPPDRLAFSDRWIGGAGPDFLRANRYDVLAVAPANPAPEQMPVMLRALLAERFNLQVHRETRNLPSYALVAAREDKRLGPRLRAAEAPCVAPPPPRPTARGDMTPTPCIIRNVPGKAVARSVTIARLATMLPNWVGDRRPVEDRTGLAGEFDFELDWTPLQMPSADAQILPIDPNGPTLFTALDEQLGLKLDAVRTDVEVIVVDHAEPPSPD
ncbi:MAG: TIGR03435 family protein [Vicinamibacterales bacterium]